MAVRSGSRSTGTPRGPFTGGGGGGGEQVPLDLVFSHATGGRLVELGQAGGASGAYKGQSKGLTTMLVTVMLEFKE